MAIDTVSSTVVGVFENRAQAQQAVDELRRQGYTDSQIGMAAQDASGASTVAGGGVGPGADRAVVNTEETGHTTGEHAGHDAVAGGVTGAVVAGLASLLIPGIGPIVAGGILATALGGAVAGAAIGGIAGALIHAGVPEEHAGYYEGEFRSGRTLVTVQAGANAQAAREVMRRFGGYDVDSRNTTGGTTSTVTVV